MLVMLFNIIKDVIDVSNVSKEVTEVRIVTNNLSYSDNFFIISD
jgi:hypothetical protein